MTEKQELPRFPNPESVPKWTRWSAQDAEGAWGAYEAEPNQQDTGWYENEVGRIAPLGKTTPSADWRATLKQL